MRLTVQITFTMPIASARARGGGGSRSAVHGQRSVGGSTESVGNAGLTEEGHGVHAEDGAAEVDLAEGCCGEWASGHEVVSVSE